MLLLDGALVEGGVVENDNSHRIGELLGVLELNLEASLADGVHGFGSSLFELLSETVVLILGSDDACTLLSNFSGSSRSLNLKVDLVRTFLLLSHDLQALFTNLSRMGLLLLSSTKVLNVISSRSR